MNVEKIKNVMSEISACISDAMWDNNAEVPKSALRRWHETLNESLLKTPQMKDAEDAALFRYLSEHAWEFKTSFDKENQPTTIKAVFKVSTLTSESMKDTVRSLVFDFGKNAEAVWKDQK